MLHGDDIDTVPHVSRCRQPAGVLSVLALCCASKAYPNLPNTPGRTRMSGHRSYLRVSSRTPARPLERNQAWRSASPASYEGHKKPRAQRLSSTFFEPLRPLPWLSIGEQSGLCWWQKLRKPSSCPVVVSASCAWGCVRANPRKVLILHAPRMKSVTPILLAKPSSNRRGLARWG